MASGVKNLQKTGITAVISKKNCNFVADISVNYEDRGFLSKQTTSWEDRGTLQGRTRSFEYALRCSPAGIDVCAYQPPADGRNLPTESS